MGAYGKNPSWIFQDLSEVEWKLKVLASKRHGNIGKSGMGHLLPNDGLEKVVLKRELELQRLLLPFPEQHQVGEVLLEKQLSMSGKSTRHWA